MTRIEKQDAIVQYKTDYKAFAIYVVRVRVTPDIRDGLKTVHRRILWGGYRYAKAYGSNFVKSANWVGRVLGEMHPHGDVAVYDSMKPMVNYWDINVPLINGEGNWGSIQGNSQAASRYTECKLSEFAMKYVLGNIIEIKDVVDWVDTYTGKAQEPEFFAVKVPLLLINGTFGIGIGMKTYVPPHATNDIVDITIKLIDNPNMEVIIPPDQCLPCDVIPVDSFKSISKLGYGKFRVRGRVEIIESIPATLVPNKEFIGKPGLLITSTPDMVNLTKIYAKLEELVSANKLPQVLKVLEPEEDEYDANGKKKKKKKGEEKSDPFLIILKKGSDPNYVRDALYKFTDMDTTFTVNMEVLDHYNPVRVSYRSYLLSFIENAKCDKFRYYANLRQKVKTQYIEKEAYIKALQSGKIKDIQALIEKQAVIDDDLLMEQIINMLGINDLQARYIINSRQKELSIGYLNKYIAEAENLMMLDNLYLQKMLNEHILEQEIKDDLLAFKAEYGKNRNCKTLDAAEVNNIPKGTFKIVITEKNFIKKVSENTPIGTFKDDRPVHHIIGENEENIMIFDAFGKVYKLPIHKIPISDKNSNGIDIRLLIKQLTSKIIAVYYEPTLMEYSKKVVKHFMVVLTKGNNIKKLSIGDILGAPLSGIFFVKLGDGDVVSDVMMVGDGLDVICYSKNKALRMNISEIPEQRRSSKGNKAMDSDEIDGLSMIGPTTTDIIIVTKNGHVNRIDSISLLPSNRAKAGSRVIKLKERDEIKYIFGANSDNVLKVLTKNDKLEIPVAGIPLSSSASTGTKIIPLKNGDVILSCKIKKMIQS